MMTLNGKLLAARLPVVYRTFTQSITVRNKNQKYNLLYSTNSNTFFQHPTFNHFDGIET